MKIGMKNGRMKKMYIDHTNLKKRSKIEILVSIRRSIRWNPTGILNLFDEIRGAYLKIQIR